MHNTAGKGNKAPLFWPLVMIVAGGLLLLSNFLLLEDFNVLTLWPLLLVAAGAYILLRGDVLPMDTYRNFGITRGSVEMATLEISAGSVDVGVRALRPDSERLIAGQYASQSRPELQVDGTHAYLYFNRSQTPWFALADWQLGLAQQLPWQLYISTSIGQVELDLSQVICQGGYVATGLGDIQVVSPPEAFEYLQLHSKLGSIRVQTPPGIKTQIVVRKTRFFGVQADPTRYEEVEPHTFVARAADPDAPLVKIAVSGVFGDAHLS